MAARAIWKGAISFGLVHVPVALVPASSEKGIDFDWLDKRSMDPVGYKRVNKRTGKEVAAEDIVRGVKLPGGDYVVLGDDEIKAAYPKTTQTIAIEAFVEPSSIPFTLLEKPYYLEPQPRAEKVYALLREAMLAAGVLAVARVVMHTKEHLAVLVPSGQALMLDTLRWAAEIRPWDELKLPPAGTAEAGIGDAELEMARQLVASMTKPWKPEENEDRFTQAIEKLVEQRAAAGKTEAVQPLEEAGDPAASNVVDLTELLRRSLGGRGGQQEGNGEGDRPAAPSGKGEGRPRSARKAGPAKKAARQTAAAPARKRA